MPIAQDVKNLAQDIEISYGERMAYLSDLFRGTDKTLKTFHHSHQKMATDLWDSLTANGQARQKTVESLRRKNQRDFSSMAEELANFLKESRRAMKKQSDVLSSQIRDYLRSMEKEISRLLANFKADRQAMSQKTREELASTAKRRIREVEKTLSNFAAEHKEQSKKIREELSSFKKGLEKTAEEMRAPVISELKKAKENWQTLGKIMAAKRAGKAVTPAKKIGEVPAKEVAKAAEAFSAGKAKEQIMRLISQSGNGLTLPQMGKALRVPYIRLASPINELVKEGRVEKEDSQYFRA